MTIKPVQKQSSAGHIFPVAVGPSTVNVDGNVSLRNQKRPATLRGEALRCDFSRFRFPPHRQSRTKKLRQVATAIRGALHHGQDAPRAYSQRLLGVHGGLPHTVKPAVGLCENRRPRGSPIAAPASARTSWAGHTDSDEALRLRFERFILAAARASSLSASRRSSPWLASRTATPRRAATRARRATSSRRSSTRSRPRTATSRPSSEADGLQQGAVPRTHRLPRQGGRIGQGRRCLLDTRHDTAVLQVGGSPPPRAGRTTLAEYRRRPSPGSECQQ